MVGSMTTVIRSPRTRTKVQVGWQTLRGCRATRWPFCATGVHDASGHGRPNHLLLGGVGVGAGAADPSGWRRPLARDLGCLPASDDKACKLSSLQALAGRVPPACTAGWCKHRALSLEGLQPPERATAAWHRNGSLGSP